MAKKSGEKKSTGKTLKVLLSLILLLAPLILLDQFWTSISWSSRPESSTFQAGLVGNKVLADPKRNLNSTNVTETSGHPPIVSHLAPDTETNLSSSSLSRLQLFITTFPGGFWELENTFFYSLRFFYPRHYLDLVVVLDEPDNTPANQAKIYDMVGPDWKSCITIVSNPRYQKTEYGKGWFIQQLIMLWADNFTTADYIGYIDDDAMFSRAIQEYDLFDEQGRPRAIVRYPAGFDVDPQTGALFQSRRQIEAWYRSTYWAYGNQSGGVYVCAMSYFPVVVHRKHLALAREAMMEAHPEYTYFDQIYHELRKDKFSQFILLMDFVWKHHREDYSWHFEAFFYDKRNRTHGTLPYFSDGYPQDREVAKHHAFVESGSLSENGVKPEMISPFPRCAVHASYKWGGKKSLSTALVRRNRLRKRLVQKILRVGYCFSQPLVHVTRRNRTIHNDTTDLLIDSVESVETTSSDPASRCHNDLWNDKNLENEWLFEERIYGSFWPEYDPDGVLRAHRERMLRNGPHDWDHEMVQAIFS